MVLVHPKKRRDYSKPLDRKRKKELLADDEKLAEEITQTKEKTKEISAHYHSLVAKCDKTQEELQDHERKNHTYENKINMRKKDMAHLDNIYANKKQELSNLEGQVSAVVKDLDSANQRLGYLKIYLADRDHKTETIEDLRDAVIKERKKTYRVVTSLVVVGTVVALTCGYLTWKDKQKTIDAVVEDVQYDTITP